MAYNQTYHTDPANSTDGYCYVTDTGTTNYHAGSEVFAGPVSFTSAVALTGTLTGTAGTVAGTLTESATVTQSGTRNVSGTIDISGTLSLTSAAMGPYKDVTKLTTALAASVALKCGGLVVVRATGAAKTYSVSSTNFPVGSQMIIYATAASTSRNCNVKVGAASTAAAPLTVDGTNYVISFREPNLWVKVFRATTARMGYQCSETTASTALVWTVTGGS